MTAKNCSVRAWRNGRRSRASRSLRLRRSSWLLLQIIQESDVKQRLTMPQVSLCNGVRQKKGKKQMATCRKREECCLTCYLFNAYPPAERRTFYDDGYYVTCDSPKCACTMGAAMGLEPFHSPTEKCSGYQRDDSL